MLIENCRSCSVYSLKHSHLFDASVETKEDSIILFFPEFESTELSSPTERLRPFQFDALIDFYTPSKGVVSCDCHVVAQRTVCLEEDNVFAGRCEIKQVHDVVDRRNDLKIKSTLSVSVEIPTEKGLIQANGRLRDISAGGVYFVCRKMIETGSIVEITFEDKNLPLTLKARILRRNELKNSYFGYGCQFSSIRSGEENTLRRYVFQQQQIAIQQQRHSEQMAKNATLSVG